MQLVFTIAILIAAGVALVLQNLLMVRITESVPNVLYTLLINSSTGLVLLLCILLMQNKTVAITHAAGTFRIWYVLPGILGSFFVFAGILGYQKVGAATTIAVVVASQLIAGLFADTHQACGSHFKQGYLSYVGAVFLIIGALFIVRGRA